jgi:hypothetical protein
MCFSRQNATARGQPGKSVKVYPNDERDASVEWVESVVKDSPRGANTLTVPGDRAVR